MNTITELLPDIKLRINMEHPDFEECYAFGYECARADLGESENPFSTGSKESEYWVEGWWAGFYGEAPLYDLKLDSEPTVEGLSSAANDEKYLETRSGFFTKVLEISGVIAVSAFLGYQVIDLVA